MDRMRFSRTLKLLVPLVFLTFLILLISILTRIEINRLREIFTFSVGKRQFVLAYTYIFISANFIFYRYMIS